jgi:hypothetical protein
MRNHSVQKKIACYLKVNGTLRGPLEEDRYLKSRLITPQGA